MSRENYLNWMKSDAETLFFRVCDITRKLMSQARNERRYLFMSGSRRLAAFLADAYERRQKDGILALAITRQQLADELGVSGKTVQRALKTLSEQELVKVQGRKLIMNHLQYERLQTLSAQKQNDFDSEE
jgi:CRP/FNR family cyclic AMP-dependent transcriptional regulator